jgi:IS30 family transposase
MKLYSHLKAIDKNKLFNCDAYNSGQKGTLENKHRILRHIIPKGVSINQYSDQKIKKLVNFVNCYYSKRFNIL